MEGVTCVPTNVTAFWLGKTPGCTLGGYPAYVLNATNVAQIQLAVNIARELNLRLVIKNTGHDFGGKSVGMGSLSIWTHYLKDYRFYNNYNAVNYTGPAFKFGAGLQVYEVNEIAKAAGVTVVGGEGAVRENPSYLATPNFTGRV